MPLIDYLDYILEWHTRHNSPVAKFIQPGLSSDEILFQIGHLPFKMPREFAELYHWRNGVPFPLNTPAGDMSFFEYHRFLPLEEALGNFQISYPIMKEFYEITDWVLTFQDPAGDGYGILGSAGSTQAAPVTFLFEGEGVQIVFDTLTQMMKTVVAGFDEGVFSWRQNALHTDFEQWGQVAHRLNPNSRYWRDYVRGSQPST